MRQPGIPHPRLPLPGEGQPEDLAALQRWLVAAIPQVAELGLGMLQLSDDRLSCEVALAPNLNDKGTGYGGAMASQSILLGWCWLSLWLRRNGREQDVVIVTASQRFLAPVNSDYRLTCEPQEQGAIEALTQQLSHRDKGRITLQQRLYCGTTLCMESHGEYAVLPPH